MDILRDREFEITFPGNMNYPVSLKFRGSGTLSDPYRFSCSLQNLATALTIMNMQQQQCFPEEFYAVYKGIIFRVKKQSVFKFEVKDRGVRKILLDDVKLAQEQAKRLFIEG